MYWLYILFIAQSIALFPVLLLASGTIDEVLTHIPNTLAAHRLTFSITFVNALEFITLHFQTSKTTNKKRLRIIAEPPEFIFTPPGIGRI